MGDQRQFTLKQIVWAKVSDYPWWPARIIKALTQHNTNIYKVHFFADLSYCYLQSQQLLDFQSGFAYLQQKHFTDLILKKSIQLAKAAFQKSKSKSNPSTAPQQNIVQPQPSNPDSFQQTKIESKPMIQNCQKYQLNKQIQTQIKEQNVELFQIFNTLNAQNVIELINSPFYKSQKKSKGYNNRKQVLNLQLKFKEVLLSKYNLHQVSKLRPIQKNPIKHVDKKLHRIHRKKLITKPNKNMLKNKNIDIGKPITKKLFKIIRRNLNYSNEQAKNEALKYFYLLDQNMKKNRKELGKNYLSMVRSIKSNSKLQLNFPQVAYIRQLKSQSSTSMTKHEEVNMQSAQIQAQISKCSRYDEESSNNYLSLIKSNYLNNNASDLQFQLKKQDEERSKITLMQACVDS